MANAAGGPEFVKTTDEEITRLALHLGLSETTFIQEFTRLRPGRDGLALIERENGECVFLDGITCQVQAVKPEQCR